MVKIKLFAPLVHEIPKGYKKKVSLFGMGNKKAIAFAETLSSEAADYFIIFGTAGALSPSKKIGDCFIVSILKENNTEVVIPIPKKLEGLPQTSLTTVKKIAPTQEAKQNLFKTHQAELVDMEMIQIWTHLSPEIQNKTIFIRGVIDEAEHSIEFLKHPFRLLSIKGVMDLKLLIQNFKVYRKSMGAFLNEVESRLAQRAID